MIKTIKRLGVIIKDRFQFNIEWKFFKSPTAQEFKSYYPINHSYWDELEVISIKGATLYSFGIDPHAIDLEFKIYKHTLAKRTLPKGFVFRHRVIVSAVQSGSIELAHNKKNDITSDTLIKFESFKEWLRKKEFYQSEPSYQDIKAALTKKMNEDTPENKAMSDALGSSLLQIEELAEEHIQLKTEVQLKNKPFQAVLPPLPLKGIAKMFLLVPNSDENLKLWKKHAKNAKRNLLNTSRARVVGGKAQSHFYPEKVANWLAENGHMPYGQVERILRNNLPNNLQYLNDLDKE
jgi:hypothetical protein